MSQETLYSIIRRRGVSRRNFLKFCSLTAASLGLEAHYAQHIAHALETKPRLPVIWFHGNECTCCSESFIRSAHPLMSDVVLSMISLEYDDLLMAAAGHQAEAAAAEAMEKYKGEYVLAVEGDAPLNEDGMYCFVGGKPFVENLRKAAEGAKFIIAWGQCSSFGCVQQAKPNPTLGRPMYKLGLGKPLINIPGCPPIAEVMTGVLSYIITFGRMPELDGRNRPVMFYGQRIHDKCYRRAHFDAGQFAEAWDDEGARTGYCLYKLGCRGPTTHNACATVKWNNGTSFPIQSGHGCIGCAEENFWDRGPFYKPTDKLEVFNRVASADTVGKIAAGAAAAFVAGHAVASVAQSMKHRRKSEHRADRDTADQDKV